MEAEWINNSLSGVIEKVVYILTYGCKSELKRVPEFYPMAFYMAKEVDQFKRYKSV